MSWIQNKNTNYENVKELLKESYETNHMTNGGPLVKKLEEYFFNSLEIHETKCVIACCNGAAALNNLVDGIKNFKNKELKFNVQDFTFPCSLQGSLKDSYIVDLDENYQFNLNQVKEDSDGIVVTNLFGNSCNIKKYTNYCDKNKKILLFDNATCPYTYYNGININNFGNGCIISLHHTKPIGFGEGGLIICDKIFEESVRNIQNFGYSNSLKIWNLLGNNYKMSDISAAYILDYQNNINNIRNYNKILFEKFSEKVKSNNKIKIFPSFATSALLSCIVIIYDGNSDLKIKMLNYNKIEVKKYYTPLKNFQNSSDLFDKILCIPCNFTITDEVLEKIILILNSD